MLEVVVTAFFRAVSHQLYGNPNNHFYLRSVGVQYLVHNPEQFIESNTENSWQGYLQRMSNQGTWADAIIIQAVANCLNLSIHIIESNPAFSPLTVVEPMNATDVSLRIYIGHEDEIHYVSTSEMQRTYSNDETNKDKKNQRAQKRKLNLGHIREIERKSFRKRKAANPELVREINKQSVRKRKAANPELVREIYKQSVRKRKAAIQSLYWKSRRSHLESEKKLTQSLYGKLISGQLENEMQITQRLLGRPKNRLLRERKPVAQNTLEKSIKIPKKSSKLCQVFIQLM